MKVLTAAITIVTLCFATLSFAGHHNKHKHHSKHHTQKQEQKEEKTDQK